MALSGRFASKIKGFMTEGIKKLYDEESTSLSRDFIAPKTTRQQVQEAQATTVTPTDISHEQIPEDTLPFQRERVRKLQKIEEENLGLPIKSKVEEVGAYVNPLSPSDPNYDPKYWENVSSAATKKVIKPGMNKFGEFEPTSYWLHERQRIGDLNLPRGFKLKPNEYPLLNKDRTQFKGSLRKAFQKNGFNTDTLYDFFNEKNPEDAINILWEACWEQRKHGGEDEMDANTLAHWLEIDVLHRRQQLTENDHQWAKYFETNPKKAVESGYTKKHYEDYKRKLVLQ